MGEYIKHAQLGEIKLGTCENLYYISHRKYAESYNLGLFSELQGNGSPDDYLNPKHGFRFRFPFPDEDDTTLGDYDDFDRGELFTIDRDKLPEDFQTDWQKVTGRMKATFGSLDVYAEAENPNNTAKQIKFEVVQQRFGVSDPSVLCVVFRCPYTGAKFRVEDATDIIKVCSAISQTYLINPEGHKFSFYDELLRRIYEGYKLPYVSKLEYLQD
jgi:hypothetical protein